MKTLLLWGANDTALDISLAERLQLAVAELCYNTSAELADVRVRLLEGGDHFIQQDLLDLVTARSTPFSQSNDLFIQVVFIEPVFLRERFRLFQLFIVTERYNKL